MREIVATVSGLLLGVALMMLGNGLQGTLLGMRASIEGFPHLYIGIVMAGYYLGFLAGSTQTPRIVERVGHVRAFGLLTALASALTLLHIVFINPAAWFAIRLASGFCFAGLFVVAESWLNHVCANAVRGSVFALYMTVQLGSMAGGQFLLNVDAPEGFKLFILIAVLVSLSAVPILLVTSPTPRYDAPRQLSLRRLYEIAPLGVCGTLGVGMAHSAFWGMGGVYAQNAGFSTAQTSLFMGVTILGGVVCQWPVGRFSDRFDRRKIIVYISYAAAAAALAILGASFFPAAGSLFLCFLFGAMFLPQYSLFVAHTNDHLRPDEMVAASSSLILAVGVGASLGPVIVGGFMAVFGARGYFFYLALMHVLLGSLPLYWIRKSALPLPGAKKSVTGGGGCAIAAPPVSVPPSPGDARR